MTSNPGDEKVIQDDVRFKGETSHRSQTTEESNTVRHASPGEVQAKLDEVRDAGGGRVELNPSETYDPSSPWAVYANITLDCRGALIQLTTDTDIFHVHSEGKVLAPQVDVTGVTYTSAVFTFDETFDDFYDFIKDTRVEGGYYEASHGEGTLFYLHSNGGRVNGMQFLDTRSEGFGTVYDYHIEGSGGTIRCNLARGIHQHFSTGIHQRGNGKSNANEWQGILQPMDIGGFTSSYGWRMEIGSGNSFVGQMWDVGKYSQSSWLIGSGSGSRNTITVPHIFDQATVTDNSGSRTNYINESTSLITDQLHNNTFVGPDQTIDGGANRAVGVGYGATLTSDNTVAIGNNAEARAIGANVIGDREVNDAPNSFAYGGNLRMHRTGVKTGDYTTVRGDEIVPVDTSGGAVTITLDAGSVGDGRNRKIIKDEGGAAGTNAITVSGSNATIDGNSSVSIASNYGQVRVYSDGSNWFTW